ncbi:MAG TPA: tetratricopeptide repeat protein [Thermoanaerobaculia bacterium]|nr:tetratricopeptide repeat protein [Thermoanaerobaculia bacterium]
MSGAESVDWLPAVAVLLAGLFGGLIVMLVSRGRRGQLAREVELESLDDLEQQRDLLIERLREMRSSTDRAAREVLETEAAGVLRRIEELKRQSKRPKKAAHDGHVEDAEPLTRGTSLKGFLWGVGAAVVLGSIVLFVANSATERGEGGSVTGGVGMEPAPQQQQMPQMSAEAQNLEQWVAQNPDDLDARLQLASIYVMQQEMMKVWEQTNYVLERVPGHPRAKGYQAVVRLAMGQTAMGLQMLEEAIEADPSLLDARIHLALAYLQMGRPQEAVRILEKAKEVHPTQSAMIDELVQEIMTQWPEVQTGS